MSNFMRAFQEATGGGGGGGGRVVSTVAKALVGLGLAAYGIQQSLWTVEVGHRGVMFSRIGGVKDKVFDEGLHLRVPWFETPTIFDIRTRPRVTRSVTGTRDLQMVDVGLRVLYKPAVQQLPRIYERLSTDFDERILPSIINETLKSVVAQFNASQLITQREQVSKRIRQYLTERAQDFDILVDDVSIVHLSFGKEYTAAVEAKQVAQQEAERAKFIVDKSLFISHSLYEILPHDEHIRSIYLALQDKKSTVIRAQGEAKSAELIGAALARNPGYVELRRLEAARGIAQTVAQSSNQIYLNSDSLLLNLLKPISRYANEGIVRYQATWLKTNGSSDMTHDEKK